MPRFSVRPFRRLVLKLLHLNSHHYRLLFIGSLLTLGISGGVIGTMLLVSEQAHQAVHEETSFIMARTQQQLAPVLQSRRSTLTLLREMLDQAPAMSAPEQQALATSAVGHTPHLLGVGWVSSRATFHWWAPPAIGTTAAERADLIRDITRRLRPGLWRAPSMWTVPARSCRPFLVMAEPFHTRAHRGQFLVAIFDLQPLLGDFFKLTFQGSFPVQLVEGAQVLYRSARWSLNPSRVSAECAVRFTNMEWRFEVQSSVGPIVPGAAWSRMLLLIFGLLAVASLAGLLWPAERLRHLATTDELTGLANRRRFLERWQEEYTRSQRYRRELSCVMIDVNGFKQINDTLGHPAGDLLLKEVAKELKARLRQTDILARFGGDEFIVALPETGPEQAAAVVEKLRALAIYWPWTTHPTLGPVRVSVGVSHLQPEESSHHVIQRADANLYASRRAVRQAEVPPAIRVHRRG